MFAWLFFSYWTSVNLGSLQNILVVLDQAIFHGVGTRFYPSLPHNILRASGNHTQQYTTHCAKQTWGLVDLCTSCQEAVCRSKRRNTHFLFEISRARIGRNILISKRTGPTCEQILVIRNKKHLKKCHTRCEIANNLGNNLLVSVSW